jgi:hypothetical protein
MERRTVGRKLTSPNGRTYRPSMWLTVTLPSYGKVHNDPSKPHLLGVPVDLDAYDYRRAALDALHFPKLVDRFWQNLRRCSGFKVQYFGCVEPQKRLALHMHAAVRGVIPRPVFDQVVKATYEQVWWPTHDEPVYTGRRLPLWDDHEQAYVDPDDRAPLTPWDQAMEATYEPDAEPAHLLRFGEQMDSQWYIPGSPRTDKRIGYICKYVTKSIAEAYDPDTMSTRQQAHLYRLHAEARWLPCCPECPNWLRYGIQPSNPGPGMQPGYCNRPAHQLENLGHGGRRVLVSRDWSGKTLAEHKADRAQVVRAVLAEAGMDVPDTDRWSADQAGDDGTPRYVWEPVDITADADPETYRIILRRAITEQLRWRVEYHAARELAGPTDTHSATDPNATPCRHDPGGMSHHD